jgi:hypothetical protein
MATPPTVVANYSKSYILSRRVLSRLESLDSDSFPTPHTESACRFLGEALKAVADPSTLEDKEPVDVHGFVTIVHEIVELIEESSSGRMAWPLTNFCDEIWTKLFPSGGPELFYIHAPEYNYFVAPFSSGLLHELENVLPPSQRTELEKKFELWSLSLPSIEDRNLPLYANIVHEFGHVLFDANEAELEPLLAAAFAETFQILSARVSVKPTMDDVRVIVRINAILRALSQEIFSDLLAALVMGPGFYLSLYETSWPQAPSVWSAELAETELDISAHPAPAFRLSFIREKAEIDNLKNSALERLSREGPENLGPILQALDLPVSSNPGFTFEVVPEDDRDSQRISRVLSSGIPEVEKSSRDFAKAAEEFLRTRYNSAIVTINESDICALLERMQNDVIPNIIPDDTLLGRTAGVAEILSAAAIYRLNFLATIKSPPTEVDAKQLDKIERLTAKALEASFVQSRYKAARHAEGIP